MPLVRIQLTETVRYRREVEMSQEDLDELLEFRRSNKRCQANDFWVDVGNIEDGECESDDVEIDVKQDGKWVGCYDD